MATANASDLRKDLASRFVDAQNDEALMSECLSLCMNYNLSADDLFYKWEAMSYNSTPSRLGASSAVFTVHDARALGADFHREVLAHKAREQLTRATLRPKHDSELRITRGTAIGAAVRSKPARRPVAGTSRVIFRGPSSTAKDVKERKYRYMYEKISERSAILDERIDEIGELIREHYKIDELGDPSSTSEEEIVVVGRICLDAESSISTSGKLNDTSMFLESSRMMGSGARILLRFDYQLKLRGTIQGAGGIGIFPGAIVALKGKNGGGGWFAVSEILGIPPLSVSPSSLAIHDIVKAEPGSGTFSMCIASGPFTSDADLAYNPLASLIGKAKSVQPAVLLLLGPFVDIWHPQIKSGDIDQSVTDIFHERIMERLRDFLDSSPGSIVILVPSLRDAMSDHNVFPQCQLGSEFSADVRIKMLPNPCRFFINDVSFAASSVDVLFHLRSQEYVKRGNEIDPISCTGSTGNDLLANACRHIFHQRSFYPLFPVPVELTHEVNLDITHSDRLRLDHGDDKNKYAPDVLIMPSKLKHFSKGVSSTLAINPSFLTKGTFAMVDVGEKGNVSMRERIRCELVKL